MTTRWISICAAAWSAFLHLVALPASGSGKTTLRFPACVGISMQSLDLNLVSQVFLGQGLWRIANRSSATPTLRFEL